MAMTVMSDAQVAEFDRNGFVLLRRAFEAEPLSAEVDRALAEGFVEGPATRRGSAGNEFQYVPMMVESTPRSLALVVALAAPARQLLGRDVLPVRAKGTRYFDATGWHRDRERDIASVGFAAYLEPLDGGNGALRVLPGSQRSAAVELPPDGGIEGLGEAVHTEPGDVIAFDEGLWHASAGGRDRRQWRVDFVVDPRDAAEESEVRAYFAGIYVPGWDGGYDVDRYPSYGRHWQAFAPRWHERLADLGATGLAEGEESEARAARVAPPPAG